MLNDASVCLIVDLANVMGSRPDGWWRDRAGAASRWLAELDPLVGRSVALPGGPRVTLSEVVVVVEGQARAARDPRPSSLRVVRAERDGDSAIVAVAEEALARVGPDAPPEEEVRKAGGVRESGGDGEAGGVREAGGDGPSGGLPLVVTADRGLRDRLPPGVAVAGPGWLRDVLDRPAVP